MTYKLDDENAIEDTPLPSWVKTLRWLVYILIVMSILAMLALIYGAFKIITKETSLLDVSIPDAATLISVSQMPDGRMIVIYETDKTMVELRGEAGNVLSEAELK